MMKEVKTKESRAKGTKKKKTLRKETRYFKKKIEWIKRKTGDRFQRWYHENVNDNEKIEVLKILMLIDFPDKTDSDGDNIIAGDDDDALKFDSVDKFCFHKQSTSYQG